MNRFENLSGVVVGLGSIGNRHLLNLIELGVGRLTAVRRSDSSNQQFQVPEQVTVSRSLDVTLTESPDFVVVCNPSNLHVTTARKCFDANCHVLVEKPLCVSAGEAELELDTAATRSGKIAATAYCMRYHPAFAKAYEAIHAGVIGRVVYAKAWFEGFLPDWHPWEDYRESYAARPELGGGVLRTLDHELDFLNWTLGPAETARGWVGNNQAIGIGADELAMYQLRHPEGVLSQVATAFCRKPASRGFEFVGTTGTLSFRMEEGQLRHASHESDSSEVLADLSEYDINQMYVDLASDFLESIERGKPSSKLATIKDGIHCATVFDQIDYENHESQS